VVIELLIHTNFYVICNEISHITFPPVTFHVISYLPSFVPSFLPSVFLSFVFCGAPACFQAINSLCNISLPHLMLSSDFIYSFPKSYLGFIFMNTAACYVLSFFSHTVQLILYFTLHVANWANVVCESICLQVAPP
jgi:hypothetical protein